MGRWLCALSSFLFVSLLAPLVWAQVAEPETVLKAREAALTARKLGALLGLFADDAVIVTSSGRLLTGKAQIHIWVQDQIDRSQREEAGLRQQQGSKLSWAGRVYRDDWQTLGISPLEVRQDAIVRDGKIKFFNTTFTPESWAQLQAARAKN